MREFISFAIWPVGGVSLLMLGSHLGYGREFFWGIIGTAVVVAVIVRWKNRGNRNA